MKEKGSDPVRPLSYLATDLNQNQGPQTVEEGAQEAVRLATLPGDGPTGGYFDKDGVRPW